MGRTLNAVDSSGTPKKMEGIKSKKVWVILIATIMTPKDMASNPSRGYMLRPIKHIVLTCIAGVRPVISPRKQPNRQKANNPNIYARGKIKPLNKYIF